MELFKLLGKIAIDNTEANTAIDDTTKKAGNAEGKTKKSFGGIGKAAGTMAKGMLGAGAAVGGALMLAVESTREYRREMGMLETSFSQVGLSSDAAKNTYTELNAVLGDSGQAVEASQHLALIADNEEELAGLTNTLTGVYATFGESLPLEGLAEGINHTASLGEVQGSLADALEWSGITVDDFNGQLAKCSNEQERQELITSTLNDLYGEAGKKYKEVNKDVLDAEKAQSRLTDTMARVGAIAEPMMTLLKNGFASVLEAVLPFAESIAQKVPSAVDKMKNAFAIAMPYLKQAWNALWIVLKTVWDTVGKPVFGFVMDVANQVVALYRKNWPAIANVIRDVFNIIKSLWNNVLKPVLTILGNYVKNTLLPIWKVTFKGIMEIVQVAFNGIIKLWNGSLKPILNGIIQFVSGVLTGNWKKAWNGIKNIVSGVFSGIKTAVSTGLSIVKTTFSSGLEVVRKTVKTVIDKIKGYFNTTLKFKGLKMPSIKLTMEKGSGLMAKAADLLGLSGVPKFSVKWNAEGGILKRPSIFGYDAVSGQFLGGGEAGDEAVAPIDTLMSFVSEAVRTENEPVLQYMQMLVSILENYLPQIVESNTEIILDGDTLVGKLAPAMDRQLGILYTKKNRGNV